MKRMILALALVSAAPSLAHEGKEHRPREKHAPATPATPAAPATPTATPSAPAAHAPGDHAHDSPHGGLVVTVDKDTHVEVLFADTDVKVWFYDADMKPVALPTDAKATVVIGKEVKKLALPVAQKPDGTTADHLGAPLAMVKDQKLSIVIQGTVAGKARSARVERAADASTPAPATTPATPAAPAAPPASK